MTLLSMSEVDVAVGLVGNDADWNSSVDVLSDILHDVTYDKIINTGVTHTSLASSLITLVVRAKTPLVATNNLNELTFTLDYLTSMHFLDNVKFLQVQALVKSGLAYTQDMNNGFMEIQWTGNASDSCSTGNNNLYSCAIRRSIVAGVTTPTNGAQDFSNPDHSNDDIGCVNFITSNLLGTNAFSIALAANMTSLVRSRFAIDNYIRKAWYINPGYEWPIPAGSPAQSQLSLTDKMIALAVISLRDSVTGIVRGRRLMSIVSDGGKHSHVSHEIDTRPMSRGLLQSTDAPVRPVQVPSTAVQREAALTTIKNTPINSPIPVIQYNVDVMRTLGTIYGIPPSVQLSSTQLTMNVKTTQSDPGVVRKSLADFILGNVAGVCPLCDAFHLAFQNVEASTESVATTDLSDPLSTARRQLTQTASASLNFYVATYYAITTGVGNATASFDSAATNALLSSSALTAGGLELKLVNLESSVPVAASPAPTPAPTPPPTPPRTHSPTPSPTPPSIVSINNDDGMTLFVVIIVIVSVLICMMGICVYRDTYYPVDSYHTVYQPVHSLQKPVTPPYNPYVTTYSQSYPEWKVW
jgi:hypothetical protein